MTNATLAPEDFNQRIQEIKLSMYDSSDGGSGLRITNYSVTDMNHTALYVDIPWEQMEEVAKEMLRWSGLKANDII